jgi:cytochrome P450
MDAEQIEPLSKEMLADPHPAYRAMRERGRVIRDPSGTHWVVTGYDETKQVLTDARFGEAAGRGGRIRVSLTNIEGPDGLLGRVETMLSSDPPEHTRLRRLVSKAFTPRSIELLRLRIQEIVDGLLDGLEGRAEFDLISELAWPLPITVIAEMLGVPAEDRASFKRWSDEMVATLGGRSVGPAVFEQARQANRELAEYFSRVVAERRASPRDDLISGLVAAEEQGQVLSEDEILGTLALLLVAGNETTTHLIGNGMLALFENPDEMARVRDDPKLLPSAVDELLRCAGPVLTTRRVARADVEVGGQKIARGEVVVTTVAAANRDPRKYADPDRLDVSRSAADHVAFGDGIHFCLGAPLARAEGEIAIGSLLRRFPRLRLLDEEPAWGGSSAIRGLISLRVGT